MYQVGQAVIIRWDKKTEYIGTFESQKGDTIHTGGLFNANDSGFCNIESVRPATEAEILEQAVKHRWKETNSKWLYTSPSGQLELIDNDGWTPLIKRQPLSDQFGFFGQECITAHRLITALNLAK